MPELKDKLHPWRYLIAAFLATLAFYAYSHIEPALGDHSDFLLLTIVIVLCARHGGFRTGLVATVASLVLASTTITEPDGITTLWQSTNLMALLLLLIGGLVSSMLGARLRRIEREILTEHRRKDENARRLTDEIAHRRAIEKALFESEARFVAFMDNSPAIAFIKDLSGRYVYVNKTWEKHYNLDWHNKTDPELWGGSYATMFQESDRRAVAAGCPTESFETVADKDGQSQEWWVLKFPMTDSAGNQLLGCMAMDISVQRRREVELVDAHYALTHVMPGIARFDCEGRYLEVNDTYAQMLGYAPDELVGVKWSETVHSEDSPLSRVVYEQMLQDGRASAELRGKRKDGSSFFEHVLMVKIVDSSGRPLGHRCFMRDISDRKFAEQAAKDSETRLQRLTDNIPGAVYQYRLSPDGTQGFVFVSDGIQELIGHSAAAVTEQFSLLWDEILPEDIEGLTNSILHSAKTMLPWQFDARIRLPDGTLKWVGGRSTPEPPRHDGSIVWNGILSDITDRKQIELALQESRLHLMNAQAIAHLGSWEWDFKTEQGIWSDEHYRLLGYEVDSVEANYENWFARIHPDDRSYVLDQLQVEQPGLKSHDFEYRIIRPDGEIRYVHCRGQLFRDPDGSPRRVAGALLDISDRKRAEEAVRAARDELEQRVEERTADLSHTAEQLRRSEERLQHALAVGMMGTWELDLRTMEFTWNRRFYEICGIPVDTPVDRSLFLAHVHADDLQSVRNALEQSIRENTDYVSEFRFHRPDGKVIWINTQAGILRDEEGSPIQLVGVNFDVTKRREMLESLRELNERLDLRVALRTQELAESQARLRSLVAELTRAEEHERRRQAVELHDYLAQSLALVRMNLGRTHHLLHTPERQNELRKLLTEIQGTVDESISYTRSLIAELSPRVLYDLGFPAALSYLGDQMKRHGLAVEVELGDNKSVLTEDDAVFFYQCARELLWNVVKHAATNRAKVTFKNDRGRISLVVADAGQGFHQQSSKGNGNGAHFGLFSIKERVELRGGVVSIDTAPGTGTRVALTLPCTDNLKEESSKMAEMKARPSKRADTVTVMIVDDHRMVRQGLRRVLEEELQFTIVGEAGDGPEAIAMAEQLDPNVVLMDVNLPTMSGIDATRRIMQNDPTTIIIGLSFGSDAYVADAMHKAGALSCVPKERAVEDVHQAIMQALTSRGRAIAEQTAQ